MGCKWIFRKKNIDNFIHAFKARLVPKSFIQKKGVDYFDTYALMERIKSIRNLFTLTSIYKLYIFLMNVKTILLK